mmetsp:Transcript_8119/g.12862  ORF Transcript_8119/g.12862 Transcript_8119/m.12862 type:complete len:344 (+) Transcript_8119:85-1116(+)
MSKHCRYQSAVCWWWLVVAVWMHLPASTDGGNAREEQHLLQKKRLGRLIQSRRRLRGQEKQSHLSFRNTEEVEGEKSYVYDDIYNVPDVAIVHFPFSKKSGLGQDLVGFQQQPEEEQREHADAIPTCQSVRMDFQKAADGRELLGGSFVENEWFHTYGVKIKSHDHDGKKSVHPMIFDSFNVESNELESNDVFFLGSPNFECGGFGVGQGGREGKVGENCESLGNLLVPARRSGGSNKKQKDASSSQSSGGVLVFEFKTYAVVKEIGLLNVAENSQVQVLHNDGTSATIDLESVGVNGYQRVPLNVANVDTLSVSLTTLAGVSNLDLCLEMEEGGDDEEDNSN